MTNDYSQTVSINDRDIGREHLSMAIYTFVLLVVCPVIALIMSYCIEEAKGTRDDSSNSIEIR